MNEQNIVTRVPPCSIESEIAVLGSMLIDKDAVAIALENLSKEDFYKESHAIIFEVIKNMYLNHIAIDIVTLTEELKKLKLLDRVGGPGYITSLVELVSTSANVEDYIKIVVEKSLLRKLINVGTTIIEESYADHKPAEEVLSRASEEIFRIAKQKDKRGFVNVSGIVDETMKHIERILKKEHLTEVVPTGFKVLDETLSGGLHKSNFIIIAARPSVGKTSFAMNIVANAAIRHKIPVGVFSLEMSATELMFRMLCAEAKVDSHLVNKGIFKDKKGWVRMTTMKEIISESPIYIDDSSELNILEMRTRARRLAYELQNQGSRLGLIVIDYIQLMFHGLIRRDTRQQEIADISRAIKSLAKELEIPIIGVSQLSRKPEEKGREGGIPRLSDLRESGALEQDADVVIMLSPVDIKDKNNNEVYVNIAKNRNGPTKLTKMMFVKECTTFTEIEWTEEG